MAKTRAISALSYFSPFQGLLLDSFRTMVIYYQTNYVKLLLSHLDLPVSTILISIQSNLKPFEQMK